MSEPTNTSVVRGQTLNISFNYLAIPAANFTWYINDNLFAEVQLTSQVNDTHHNMAFVNVTEEGWYRCIVQNELGIAEYTVFVDILSKIFLRCYCILSVICGFLYLCSTTPDHFCT